MSEEYWEKCDENRLMIRKALDEFLQSLCKKCSHQLDSHRANCIECCTITQEIERKAGLKGCTVIHPNGDMKVSYPDTEDWVSKKFKEGAK